MYKIKFHKLGSSFKHSGVMGQKKGVRRYQNTDGSLTPLGREHYGVGEPRGSKDIDPPSNFEELKGWLKKEVTSKLGKELKDCDDVEAAGVLHDSYKGVNHFKIDGKRGSYERDDDGLVTSMTLGSVKGTLTRDNLGRITRYHSGPSGNGDMSADDFLSLNKMLSDPNGNSPLQVEEFIQSIYLDKRSKGYYK